MTTMTIFRAAALDRKALERLADWLAVAVAVSLPWSTTATGILVVLWLLVVLPTLDVAAVRRELTTPAGGLPVLLCALAAAGLLWADVSWGERLGGFSSFLRLLAIPLLLAQFRRSAFGSRVLLGFLASVSVVLLASWVLAMFPGIPWRGVSGVPVKDYILQSEEFLICAFVLLAIACNRIGPRRWPSVLGLGVLAVLFAANIALVATGRTTLLVAPVLALLLGWRLFGRKGLAGAAVLFSILGAAVAWTSPYLHARLTTSISELHAYESRDALNSTSEHLQFIRESISFVEAAPIFGHGTGSIAEQFRKAVIGQTGPAAKTSGNPHNQILAVAIQLGLIGAGVLLAMWIAHFMLFRGGGLIAWIGIVIVTDNVVSSLVNSHLFDFTQAWLYIFGVGVAGGMALRERDSARGADLTFASRPAANS